MRAHELLDLVTHHPSVAVLAALIGAAGCGSGDDVLDGDGDGDDDPSPQLPSLVQVGTSGDLRVAFGQADTVPLGTNLSGHWVPSTDSLAIEMGGILGDSGPARFGAFRLDVTGPVAWASGSLRAAGGWTMDAGARRIPAQVVADAGGGGTPGVRLTLFDNGLPSGDTTLVWNDFLDPAPAAPAWIADAAFGYRTLAIAAAQLRLTLVDLAFAVAHDDDLIQAGPAGVTVTGLPFPGSGAAGTLNCRWDDANHSGALGPADGFTFSRQEWWTPGPGPDRGSVLSGDWSLEGYIENRDPVIAVGGKFLFGDLVWSGARSAGGAWSPDGSTCTAAGTGNVFLQQVP